MSLIIVFLMILKLLNKIFYHTPVIIGGFLALVIRSVLEYSIVGFQAQRSAHMQEQVKIWPVPSWIQRGKLRWVWALWEPRALYRRTATGNATSPGNALWMEAWYKRMQSEEIVARLAEMGVNLVSTHYYKGFGMKAEAQEMDLAARFTELCHKYGIRVLGYHQWSTICYESFMDEVPHVADWIQRNVDGTFLTYGSAYWRWLGCQQHEEFVEYLKQPVKKCLTEAKMDGIEWDGTVYKCYCSICQERFREYVCAKYPDARDVFGLPHLRHVRMPPTENGRDPLYQELMNFREDFLLQNLRRWNHFIKSINPEAAQVTYYGEASPAAPPDCIDIIVDENHNFPFVLDKTLTSKFRGCRDGMAYGRMVLETTWLRAPSTKKPLAVLHFDTEQELAAFARPDVSVRRPETAAEVKRDLAEPMMYGGNIATATWALRSVGGERAAFEDNKLGDALAAYMRFFKKHEAFYNIAYSLANVGIYRGRYALKYDFFNVLPCVWGAEQTCLQYQIPYVPIFTFDTSSLQRCDALILAEQTALSDAEISAIVGFVESGGGLVITGRTALFDEHMRTRRTHPLSHLFNKHRVIFLSDNPERLSRPERQHVPSYKDMRLPERAAELVEAILIATDNKLPFRVEENRFLGADAYQLLNGQKTIHLLNYRNDRPIENLFLIPGPPFADAKKCVMLSPDTEPHETPIELPKRKGAEIVIPKLDTYCVLVFTS